MKILIKDIRKVQIDTDTTSGGDGDDKGGEKKNPPYDILPPDQEKESKEKEEKGKNEGTPTESKTGEQDKLKIIDRPISNAEELAEEWKSKVVDAKNRNAGSMPGALLRRINTLINPVSIDWKTKLKKYVSDAVSSSKYTLPNKRFLGGGDVMWRSSSEKARLSSLIVASDTSGSVSPKELAQFVAESIDIVEKFKPKDTFLLWCDAAIYKPVDHYKRGEKVQPKDAPGGGGTSFDPPFKWIEEEFIDKGKKPGLIIYFTDGYPNYGWPDKDNYKIKQYESKIIWVIIGQGGVNDQIKVPFGRRIDLIFNS